MNPGCCPLPPLADDSITAPEPPPRLGAMALHGKKPLRIIYLDDAADGWFRACKESGQTNHL